jgi:hypothetical protein
MSDSAFVVTADIPLETHSAVGEIAGVASGAVAASHATVNWFPFGGVGRIELEGPRLVYHPTRSRRAFGAIPPEQTFEPNATVVEECGLSHWTELTRPSNVLFLRLLLRDRATGTPVLAVGVRRRDRLLDLLEGRGWEVRRYAKTVWPWTSRERTGQPARSRRP